MEIVLRPAWDRVPKLVERVIDVAWHGYVKKLCYVIPLQCDAAVESTHTV